MEAALASVAKKVHEVLISPHPGISNVTEWAKKQACWARVSSLEIRWPKNFLDELITQEERKASKRSDRKEQKVLNGIEAQVAVVKIGSQFWRDVIAWGKEKDFLSQKEIGILSAACGTGGRVPSEAQALRAVEILKQLRSEGFPPELDKMPA